VRFIERGGNARQHIQPQWDRRFARSEISDSPDGSNSRGLHHLNLIHSGLKSRVR